MELSIGIIMDCKLLMSMNREDYQTMIYILPHVEDVSQYC